MASESEWWWVVRQAYEIPDLVSDRVAFESVSAAIMDAVPEIQEAKFQQWEKAWATVGVVIRRVCKAGAAGDLDGLLVHLVHDPSREVLVSAVTGQALYAEDRPAVDSVLTRVADWVSENPRLPHHVATSPSLPEPGP